ncbi:amidohydrolase family protein [Rugosimonospora acidiphila]|uniref:Amidohydrolase family protein n=1 Tax=Rugosimonospora acidiphila TaxID=556531 RepID=A0ABP9S5B9_9ACTN
MNDADVPAFWRALGLPGLADVHVHFMPPRMLRRVWAHFAEGGPLLGRPWPVRYPWPDERRVAHLDALGVRHFSALAYAHRPAMAADLNAWTLDFAEKTPGCLPSATFYPEPGVADYVAHALERGARIFKVHLQVGGFDPNDPLLDPVWGLLADAGAAVLAHAGSGPVANGYTGPGPFGATLSRYPGLTAIIAHLGAPEYAGFLDLADRYPRVYLDTTMAFTDFFEGLAPVPPLVLPRIRELGDSGRLLLGSDFPNIPYPYAHQLEVLARLGWGDDWLRAVCWHNLTRLLHLWETR